MIDLEAVKRAGIGAAFKAGDVLRSRLGKITEINKKGEIDLVTEADLESEKAVIDFIKRKFPDHSILAEESGEDRRVSGAEWIVDPLDGTTNYAHGIGIFSVSIAFALNGEIVVGVVLNPVTGELFAAERGKGAELNGEKIGVSGTKEISDSLLVTGFPYNLKTILDVLMPRFENCLKAARGVRRLGSAALDLCFVACGRFDGFWEQNLKPWDTAAGTLIAREAGGLVTDFSNRAYSVDKNEILATNGKIHEQLLHLLNAHDDIRNTA